VEREHGPRGRVEQQTPPEQTMARSKHIDIQPKLLPVDLARQLLPGTFEHAVHRLVEHAIHLTPFDASPVRRDRRPGVSADAAPQGGARGVHPWGGE